MIRIDCFLKVSLFISGLFCLAIMFAIFIGQQQPPSHWSIFLHLNECELPCWVGIVPGHTTLVEAKQKIEQSYSDTILYSFDEQETFFKINYKPTGSSFGIVLHTIDQTQSSQSIIQEIYIYRIINPDTDLPTIPDLYTDLGNPEIVRLMSGAENEQVILLYKEQQTLVFLEDLDCDRITLKEEITQIILLDDPDAPILLGFPNLKHGEDLGDVITSFGSYFHKIQTKREHP